jgi:hypothetical protein
MYRMLVRLLAASLLILPMEASAQEAPAAPAEETIQIAETQDGFELTVPVSRLAMTIPKGGLAQGKKPEVGGGTDSPRYFIFEDAAERLFISGWFEPQDRFPGIQEFWNDETSDWSQRNLPAPQNVSFLKSDGWEVIAYDLPGPGGINNSHVRAHWLQAGTWIDIHLSVTSDRPNAELREKLLTLLKGVRVREKQ